MVHWSPRRKSGDRIRRGPGLRGKSRVAPLSLPAFADRLMLLRFVCLLAFCVVPARGGVRRRDVRATALAGNTAYGEVVLGQVGRPSDVAPRWCGVVASV